jgi:nucleoside-diphosphate-sugar epimerase
MAEFSPSKNFVFNAAAPAYLCYIAKQAGVRRYVYASSCSVYGYTENELFDEDRPVSSAYPYGISKLQGERAVLQLADPTFSVIALRKGTISGYSPRMRFDLIINAMFKSAMRDGLIRVNNPAIWRPILSMEDACMAYVRAVEASESISGIFNVASGNHTVGEVADVVRGTIEKELATKLTLDIQHIKDIRNYKVSIERARTVLSFHARNDIRSIVCNLIENMSQCNDWDNPRYYNIQMFKKLEEKAQSVSMSAAASAR